MHKIKTLPPKEKKRKKERNSTKFVPGIYTLLFLSLLHTLLTTIIIIRNKSLAPSPEILGARFQKIL